MSRTSTHLARLGAGGAESERVRSRLAPADRCRSTPARNVMTSFTSHDLAAHERAFTSATVGDVMRPGIMSCPASAPLLHVAREMAAHHIHALVVADDSAEASEGEPRVWGVVSDMDLIRGVMSGIDGKVARDLARTEAVSVEPTASLMDAVGLMSTYDVAHLVVAEDGRPVGIVSTLDIAGALAWGHRA
jgi:CBS domain-containing protein